MTDDAATPSSDEASASAGASSAAADDTSTAGASSDGSSTGRTRRSKPITAKTGSAESGSAESGSAESGSPKDAGTRASAAKNGSAKTAAGSRSGRNKRTRSKGRWWEFPVLVIVAVAVAVLVKSFLVQPFYIPSQSMERTLHGCPGCNGDKVLVNKPVYDLRDPHPGDIVVFKAPDGWEEPTVQPQRNPIVKGVRWVGQLVGVVPPDEMDLIKRVIATGGQTVKCCDASGRVQISYSGRDGPYRSLDEPYLYQDDHQAFGPVTVPKDRLWVMGDHRGDSSDSRYHCGGSQTSCNATSSTVPLDNVIGKAVLIVWPPSRWRTLGEPDTFKGHPTGEALQATVELAQTGGPLAAGGLVVAPFAWRRRRRRRPTRS